MSLKSVLLCLFVLLVVVMAKRDSPKKIRDRPRSDPEKRDKKGINENNPAPTRNYVHEDDLLNKFVETLINSEKYLKMIETVERKLSHLDAVFHEKSSSILKNVSETLRIVKASSSKELEEALTDSRINLDKIEQSVSTRDHPLMRTKGLEIHGETLSLDNRLSSMENLIRNVMSGVESIVSTMAEVKNRQHVRTFSTKPELGARMDSKNVVNELRKIFYEQKRCKCSTISRSEGMDLMERYPRDCHEIQMQGFNVSGIYKIRPDDMEPFYILCDLTTAGGGWTVFQNRYDGSQDFFKGWSDYKYGFGNLAGEFWLGLEKLYYLTNQKLYELRVEIETQHGQEAYAGYSVFTIGPEHEGFRISTLGSHYGTAGDSLSYHAGQKFSTLDTDNDEWKDGSCAVEHGGAWWYKECDKCNLNGKYASRTVEQNREQSIYWVSFKGLGIPLMKTKMMLRPLPVSKPSP